VHRPRFWHKEVPSHAPEWLSRWRNEDADPGETQCYAVIDSVAALVPGGEFQRQWSCTRGPRSFPTFTSPTWALIDIDPGSRSSIDDVLVLARLYRVALEHLRVEAMPKVTGQRGMQIWVPVRPGYTFADTRAWVEQVSRAIGRTSSGTGQL
jgi:bifunctional non-homologous end joining protein LigD